MQADGLVSLLLVADQYQLERLKYLCEQKIIGYVDAENVINMFLLSEQIKAPDLGKYTLEYLAKNWTTLNQAADSLSEQHVQRIERIWQKRYGGKTASAVRKHTSGKEPTVLHLQ